MQKTRVFYVVVVVTTILSISACAYEENTTQFDSSIVPSKITNSPESPIATPIITVIVPFNAQDIGLSPENPAPLGYTIVAEDGLHITIVSVHRNAAEELIRMNPFNTPRSDEEVVIIRVRGELLEDPSLPFTLLPLDFDILDNNGTIHPYPLTVILKDELGSQFTRAATVEGLLAFRIPKGQGDLILRYHPKDRNKTYESRWLALDN